MNHLMKLAHKSANTFAAQVPGSKSYTNRALVLAAHRLGKTEITNALICDDTQYLAKALDSFGGLSVKQVGNGFIVERTAEKLTAPQSPVYMGGAGTPARFMLAFAFDADGKTVVEGNPRLSERPMKDILDAFRDMGLNYRCLNKEGCLPVEISGGKATNNQWQVSGEISSQFLSSLLIHASQQSQFESISVSVPGHLVSKPYVNMTLDMMTKAGLNIKEISNNCFEIRPSKVSANTIAVEVDASGMSYPITAAAITQTAVKISGISLDSSQGDVGLLKVYQQMGCELEQVEDGIILRGKPLKGVDVDMEIMPDVVLSLGIAASQATGSTKITNIANLRVKECDRIAACTNELKKVGVTVEEGPDWLIIHPNQDFHSATIHTYDDHRVAMAFSLLGLLKEGIEIEDPECVSKSFPNFWQEMNRFTEFHRA